MIEVKDIFRWYRDLPKIPNNLTSIQKEEWKNDHAALFNKSFVGQNLSRCPSQIFDIIHDKITAFAKYRLDYLVSHDGTHYHYKKNISRIGYAQIHYEILYDKSKFYDRIKSINAGEMIEVEGIIENTTWNIGNKYDSEHSSDYYLTIQLSLTSINKIETRFLHAELLDENLRYRTNLVSQYREHCFIATACYGNHNATEVLLLRQYRDEIMIHHWIGRIAIDIYYFFSPPIAILIERSEFLKAFVRKKILAPIIIRIKQSL